MSSATFVSPRPHVRRGGVQLSWYEATARQRLKALLDPRSFEEFVPPEMRETSPHLPLFDLPQQFDDGMIVGCGRLKGTPVLAAAQEGRFMGGAIGEVHGAKLTGLLRAARRADAVVLICFDTGGVRLQEANAGELAIAEIMRALVEARHAGAKVIGIVGGRAGCFGGGGLIAGCCSALVVSEHGRIGVSGPEVIETHKGVEEFDSRDRALVWRTMGGKHRRLLGSASIFADDAASSIRAAAIDAVDRSFGFGADQLVAEQQRLSERLTLFGLCDDALDVWAVMGVDDPSDVPAMETDVFAAMADSVREPRFDDR